MSDLSDYDDELDSPQYSGQSPAGSSGDDPKRHARAQHNALERRRRDNIKDMYSSLRDAVPDGNNDRSGCFSQKNASRAVILKKAIDSIEEKTRMHKKLIADVQAVDADNKRIEADIRRLREEVRRDEDEQRGFIAASPGVPSVPNVPNTP